MDSKELLEKINNKIDYLMSLPKTNEIKGQLIGLLWVLEEIKMYEVEKIWKNKSLKK